MPQNKAAMESELKRLEMEEELARLEAEESAAQQSPSGPSMAEKAETFLRSGLEGASAGISEPAISGVNAILGNLIESGFDADSLKDFLSKSVDTARISSQYKSDVERRKGLEAALPGTAAIGEIAGAMAPGGLPAKAGKVIAGSVQGLKNIPAIGSILVGGAEAAAGGLATEGIKQAVQVPTGVAEPGELPKLGEVASTGAKIGAGLSAIPVVGKAIGAAAPRVLSAFGGVSPKIITDYLKREAPLEPVTSEKLQEAVTIAAQNVQDTLKTLRSSTADDLVTSVQVLKDMVVEGSKDAFAILEAEAAKKGAITVPFKIIRDSIEGSVSDLRKGAEALTPVRENAAGYLEELLQRFESRAVKGKVDLVTSKEMLQAIDEIKDYSTKAGTFSSSLDRALGKLRKAIDEPLKAIPAYREQMQKVRSATELLSQASDYFGEADKAFRNVERLVIGKDPYITGAAKRLEDMTGVKINLGLESIKTLRPVQNLLPENTETFVKSVLGGKSMATQKKLETLSMMADEDLVSLANQAVMTKEFEKLVQNGSRDVNFWKEALGSVSAMGAAGGVMAGPLGGATGAMLGYMVKSYGAPATKMVLDGFLKIRGMPTVQKLDQALGSVPPEVKQDLMNGFIRANILRLDPSEPQNMTLPPEQASQVYNEIKDSDLDAVSKANALRSLSKDGSIATKTMKQYMAGMKAPRQPVRPAQRKTTLEQDRPDRLKR
jgi:hypothetical protein